MHLSTQRFKLLIGMAQFPISASRNSDWTQVRTFLVYRDLSQCLRPPTPRSQLPSQNPHNQATSDDASCADVQATQPKTANLIRVTARARPKGQQREPLKRTSTPRSKVSVAEAGAPSTGVVLFFKGAKNFLGGCKRTFSGYQRKNVVKNSKTSKS